MVYKSEHRTSYHRAEEFIDRLSQITSNTTDRSNNIVSLLRDSIAFGRNSLIPRKDRARVLLHLIVQMSHIQWTMRGLRMIDILLSKIDSESRTIRRELVNELSNETINSMLESSKQRLIEQRELYTQSNQRLGLNLNEALNN